MPHPCFFCVRLISTWGGSWPRATPSYKTVASYDANVEKTVKTLSLLPAWPVTLQGCQLTGFYIMSTAESCYLQEGWSSRSFAAVTRGKMSKARNQKTTKIVEIANVMAEIKFPKKANILLIRPQRRKTYFKKVSPGTSLVIQWLRIHLLMQGELI